MVEAPARRIAAEADTEAEEEAAALPEPGTAGAEGQRQR
jgi:hypothetical protein